MHKRNIHLGQHILTQEELRELTIKKMLQFLSVGEIWFGLWLGTSRKQVVITIRQMAAVNPKPHNKNYVRNVPTYTILFQAAAAL